MEITSIEEISIFKLIDKNKEMKNHITIVYIFDLIGLKIYDTFSGFSYYNTINGCFYLEEDCDALKLQRLLKEKNIELNTTDIYDPDFYFDSSYISADQVQMIGA